MSEAVRALIEHGFSVWNMNRIELQAAKANRRSRALAERLGSSGEGVLRESERVDDRFLDTVL